MNTRTVILPEAIEQALNQGGTLAISISGGKDSQALLTTLARLHQERAWSGPIYAVHAHLGRAEWPQTMGHCERICRENDVDLRVVSRPQGDLVQEIQDRIEKLRGEAKPPWPDAQNRYCTSDQKRAQIDTVVRAPPWPSAANRYCTSHQKANQIDKVARMPWPTATQRYCTADQKRAQIFKEHRKASVVVAAMGMRAEESAARARKPALAVQPRTTAKSLGTLGPCAALNLARDGQRVVLDWLPLHDWTVDDVWAAMGTDRTELDRRRSLYRDGDHDGALDGWPAHPAYVFGNERLSCALCVLASRGDIINGARHNPELFQTYIEMERSSGWKFRQDLALADLVVTP